MYVAPVQTSYHYVGSSVALNASLQIIPPTSGILNLLPAPAQVPQGGSLRGGGELRFEWSPILPNDQAERKQ